MPWMPCADAPVAINVAVMASTPSELMAFLSLPITHGRSVPALHRGM
jgi:hypothetical protein